MVGVRRDADGYPEWWHVHRHPRRISFLRDNGIRTTYDLLLVARRTLGLETSDFDEMRICVGDLFAFCNAHLFHMRVHIKSAPCEKDVWLSGQYRMKMMHAQLDTTLPPHAEADDAEEDDGADDDNAEDDGADDDNAEDDGADDDNAEDDDGAKDEVTERESDDEVTEKVSDDEDKTKEEEECFLCPISHTVMVDPVVTCDGHTYEREMIEFWLSRYNVSPMTGEELSTTRVYPNHSLRAAISLFVRGGKGL